MDTADSEKNKMASDETELLLRFVAHRDHACPKCDYNLRNLTQPLCPECGEELKLTVGRRKTYDAPFILTLAPSIFSGMCAIFLSCAIAFRAYRFGRWPPIEVWVMVSFGLFSGLCGLVLFTRRRAFMKLDRGVQLFWALLAWAIHVAVFFGVLANV